MQNIFDTYFGTENLRVNLEELEAFVSSVDDCLELETQMPLSTEMYEQKALGMVWNVSSDELIIDLSVIYEEAVSIQPTKRNIVSVVSKVYDPLGLVSPVVISFKILFQELCRCKVEWDEALSEALRSKWELLLEGLRAAHLRVPRCCLSGSGSTLRLVGFCDASTKAYAAVVYLVSERMLMASKTRVAPLKPQTVSRLELLGALLLARLMTSVKCALRDG